MKTIGTICEYNPFHLGHKGHIERSRQALGGNTAVICVMSGNYVQRGDFAVFNKHARAEMAIHNGADLVIELPTPYTLLSAEGFASAGIHLLDMLGICDYISFGSESGDIDKLNEAAKSIVTSDANMIAKSWLDKGVSYATAQQRAADVLLGEKSYLFKSPNNVLGIEYIKALNKINSSIIPFTISRTGGEHDSDVGYSASAVRKQLLNGMIPESLMPESACMICNEEITSGRGPVSIENAELAVLSRLRSLEGFSDISGASEGLERRLKHYASTETSTASILTKVKTKRYTMSRIRRFLLCAALGIKSEYTKSPPPYARILALNETGKELLFEARKKTRVPVLSKPASVKRLCDFSKSMFELEATATDFYVLAYPDAAERKGGQEWRQSPYIN